MELEEAQLLRMLTNLFGRDQVVCRMSALAVCGGHVSVVPDALRGGFADSLELSRWAAGESCLFTVVDADDIPKLVFEFAAEFHQVVDPIEEEHQRVLPTLLEQAGVKYVKIYKRDFYAMLDPQVNFDLVMMLEGFFDDGEDDDEG
jgi:hypothetical protein